MKSINPQELKNWIESGKTFQLIDVREKQEYDFVHLNRSVHIPLRQLMNDGSAIDKDQPAVIYCHHGSRSQIACLVLSRKGYANLFNLNGGINDYALEADLSLPTY